MVTYSYSCSNSNQCQPQTIVLQPGTYFIECYGAQGGKGMADGQFTHPGGKGAYVSGILPLKSRTTFFLYIGGKGNDASLSTERAQGGWNGGGNAGKDIGDINLNYHDDPSGAGGGATDIRLINGPWDDPESLKSRIMVAAGGSGSCFNTFGAPGGDLNGYVTRVFHQEQYTQTVTDESSGCFLGAGQNGSDRDTVPDSGAGGGYFGGHSGVLDSSADYYLAISSSGSSYVSGYQGCQPYPDNSYLFLNPVIKNGFSEFPSIIDSVYEKGHEGNGFVRIQPIANRFFTLKHCYTLKFSKMRYIIFMTILS